MCIALIVILHFIILVVNESGETLEETSTANTTQHQHLTALTNQCKRHSSESDASTRKNQKQAASFVENWKSNRPWLVYVEGQGVYCTVCQNANKRPFDGDTWNKLPATRLRLESIKSHENGKAHKDAVHQLTLLAQCETIPETVQPEVCLSSMAKVFSRVYFLCKNRIAHTTNFGPLVDFIDFLGVKLSKVYIGKNATIRSHKSIQEMLYIMSDLVENQILDDLKKSNFFALMFDETTDCSIVEQLVIRTRFVDSDGNLKVKFLKMLDALKSTECGDEENPSNEHIVSLNATNISRKVNDYIVSKHLQFSKLVGIGTDGASVMTGKKQWRC